MPVHDWTRVEAGIFHDFHHAWIEEIKRALNRGVLPEDYYALAEQHAAGFGPDVLTLQERNGEADGTAAGGKSPTGSSVLTAPRMQRTAQTDMAHYRRRRTSVAVRHVSGDRVVAMVEVVSPGNKSTRNAMRAFTEKACELLDGRVHLLILDLHPPGKHDPHGAHAEIWEDLEGKEVGPPEKPLTLVAYESGLVVNAYVAPIAVGDALPEMPLYLEPDAWVPVPLEATYQAAYDAVPRRWRRVLEGQAT